MPSIAQQDYIVIKPKEGRAAQDDAECLHKLKSALLNGTILDCIIYDTVPREGDFSRIIGGYKDAINFYSPGDTEIKGLNLDYTPTQYSGLAAVQEAEDEWNKQAVSLLPALTADGGDLLAEDVMAIPICSGGFRIKIIYDGDSKVANLELTDTKPAEGEDFINISWEDAQKLIGLPIV